MLTSYAAQRAKLLLGCYRTGDANDPVTYVAAITAVLARYPEHVITSVTHPATGLPKMISWLPTIKEVSDACEETVRPEREHALRMQQEKQQIESRDLPGEMRDKRLSLDELKAKYGPNWGIQQEDKASGKPQWKAPSWDSVAAEYQADPRRIARLMGVEMSQ